MRGPTSKGSPYPKADLLMRAMARLFDAVVAAILALAFPAGAVLAAAYLLTADGFGGQSLGKRLVGIKVVRWKRRQEGGPRESILRNWPFALLALFQLLGPVGWVLLSTAGVVVVLAEAWRVINDERGWRFGDVMAETQVIDASVPLEIEEISALNRTRLTGVPGQIEATPS